MEETRISRMYLAWVERWLGALPGRIVGGAWLRSSITWIVLLVAVLVGVGLAVHEKGKGNLSRLKSKAGVPVPVADAPAVLFGGQPALVLSRGQAEAASGALEFRSVTLLPGRGLHVLQIVAFVPGRGEVSLLASPELAEAAARMSGAGADVHGEASLGMGGAFEVPWAGTIRGAALPGGLSLATSWQGRSLTLPATGGGSATGGLLLRGVASAAEPSVMPDGGVAQATFEAGNFEGHWPSNTQVKTNVVLSAGKLDLTVTARNVGTEAEPMGIGWGARFALSAEDRARAMLRLPSTTRAEMNGGVPTGRFLAGGGSGAVGTESVDDLYVHLATGTAGAGPEAELRNVAAGYGLRMTALSASIRAMRVVSGEGFVEIEPQTNLADPFGREWTGDAGGMTVLEPGESMEWKVRLELFGLTDRGTALQ